MHRLFILLLLAGCATTTPEGKSVVVYQDDSNLISNCDRLGSIESNLILGTTIMVENDLVTDLRNQAAEMGANGVAVTDMRRNLTGYYAQGVALSCPP